MISTAAVLALLFVHQLEPADSFSYREYTEAVFTYGPHQGVAKSLKKLNRWLGRARRLTKCCAFKKKNHKFLNETLLLFNLSKRYTTYTLLEHPTVDCLTSLIRITGDE